MDETRTTLKLSPKEKALRVLRILTEPAGPWERGHFPGKKCMNVGKDRLFDLKSLQRKASLTSICTISCSFYLRGPFPQPALPSDRVQALTGEGFIYLIGVADVLKGGATDFPRESIPRNDTCEVNPNRMLVISGPHRAPCSRCSSSTLDSSAEGR